MAFLKFFGGVPPQIFGERILAPQDLPVFFSQPGAGKRAVAGAFYPPLALRGGGVSPWSVASCSTVRRLHLVMVLVG